MNKYVDHTKCTETSINTGTEYDNKHRVLSINVEHEGIEKHAIIDTGSNISCINVSLIKNLQCIKKKEQVTITGANNSKLDQVGKINLMIKINVMYLSITING